MKNTEERIKQLEVSLEAVQQRNKKVEADKAWETSWQRRLVVLVLTYLVVVIFMIYSHIDKPWINALVPSMAFVLSTLTIPFIKKWWVKKNNKL